MNESYVKIPCQVIKDRCNFIITYYNNKITEEKESLVAEIMCRRFFPKKSKEEAYTHFQEYGKLGYGFESIFILNLERNRDYAKSLLNMAEHSNTEEPYLFLTKDDVNFLWPIG